MAGPRRHSLHIYSHTRYTSTQHIRHTSIALLDALLDPWQGLGDTRYTSTRTLVTHLLSTFVTRRSLSWTRCWTHGRASATLVTHLLAHSLHIYSAHSSHVDRSLGRAAGPMAGPRRHSLHIYSHTRYTSTQH